MLTLPRYLIVSDRDIVSDAAVENTTLTRNYLQNKSFAHLFNIKPAFATIKEDRQPPASEEASLPALIVPNKTPMAAAQMVQ